MNIFYNAGIAIYTLLTHLAVPFSKKAALLVRGRRGWRERVSAGTVEGSRTIWIHCASLGEFEQGRPLIEEIRNRYPGYRIVLTFFSPSGYEVRKGYSGADLVEYLPADLPWNARSFISMVRPSLVIFVKYEFWYNYIAEVHRRDIPLYLVSAIFRPEQHFFRWYGSFFRRILGRFRLIFVQDQRSFDLLEGAGISKVRLAGDTRFDRVAKISSTAREIPLLEQFRNGEKLFLAGSSWRKDEEIIARYINRDPGRMKWVFAPHEIDRPNIDRLEQLFAAKVVRFSAWTEADADARVLIIDNIGMLSSAYRYASIAAIGGGFGVGIHNILEPACWGIPVLFGPNYGNFREALELLKENGAMTFDSFETFGVILDRLLADQDFYLKCAETAGNYITKNTGASEIILKEIFN